MIGRINQKKLERLLKSDKCWIPVLDPEEPDGYYEVPNVSYLAKKFGVKERSMLLALSPDLKQEWNATQQKNKKIRMQNPEYKEKFNSARRDQYANNPEFRIKDRARNNQWYHVKSFVEQSSLHPYELNLQKLSKPRYSWIYEIFS